MAEQRRALQLEVLEASRARALEAVVPKGAEARAHSGVHALRLAAELARLLDTYPADDAGALHATDDSLTYDARTTVPSMRHTSEPDASDDAEKPEPSTVSGAPPSDAPRTGHTDESDAAGRYVNATPLPEYCCP